MIASMKKVAIDSIEAYQTIARNRWVIEWPGQIVLCVSSIYWTSEVTEAMRRMDGLKVIIDFLCNEIDRKNMYTQRKCQSTQSIMYRFIIVQTILISL